ncbi:hypothetical protein H2203_002041 [Taxawa tesnikishii (nom. ined.)]|nr:hypothetical protein H2203_002041 [Dothideales sp. JES 119]
MDAGLLFFSLLSLAINSVRWRVYDPHPQAGPAPAPITTTTPLAEIVLPFDRQVEVPAEDAWVWYLGMPLLGLLFLAFAWLCTAPDDESDLTAAAPSVAAASSPTKHASCQTLAWQGVDAGVQCNMDDAPVPAAVPAAPLSPISTVSMLPSAPVLSLSQIKTVFSFAPPLGPPLRLLPLRGPPPLRSPRAL